MTKIQNDIMEALCLTGCGSITQISTHLLKNHNTVKANVLKIANLLDIPTHYDSGESIHIYSIVGAIRASILETMLCKIKEKECEG